MPCTERTVKAGGWFPHEPHAAPTPNPLGAGYRLLFGKYRGWRLDQLPAAYLLWLADEADSPSLRLLAKRVLDIDVVIDDPCQVAEPSGALAADVLPLLAFRWERLMAVELGEPNPGTETAFVLNRGVWHLRDLVSEHTGRRFPTFDEMEGGAS